MTRDWFPTHAACMLSPHPPLVNWCYPLAHLLFTHRVHAIPARLSYKCCEIGLTCHQHGLRYDTAQPWSCRLYSACIGYRTRRSHHGCVSANNTGGVVVQQLASTWWSSTALLRDRNLSCHRLSGCAAAADFLSTGSRRVIAERASLRRVCLCAHGPMLYAY